MLLVLDLLLHTDSLWRIIRIYKLGNYINQMSKNELFTDYIYKNYIYCLYTIRNLSALIGKTNELFRSHVILNFCSFKFYVNLYIFVI